MIKSMNIFEYMKKNNILELTFTKKESPNKKVRNLSSYKKLYSMIKQLKHEKVVFHYDSETDSRFIVAIHSTKRGPALGGSRFYEYKNEEDVIFDVLRLSRGMSHKSAGVNLRLGGGKAVCWLDKKGKFEDRIRAYAEFLSSFDGEYITGEDVGTTVEDMDLIYLHQKKIGVKVPNVVCCSTKLGGAGDPSPFTSIGVFDGLKATVEYKLHRGLNGLKVALQGTGKVGMPLAKMLVDAGCIVYATATKIDSVTPLMDYASRKKKGKNVFWIEPEKIYDVECDVFSPCALGAILNKNTIPRLKCPIVAGSANNQLEDEIADGERLRKRGILYAPDFIINAGGLINAAEDYFAHRSHRKWKASNVKKKLSLIPTNLKLIYRISEREDITTAQAALKLAEERIKR